MDRQPEAGGKADALDVMTVHDLKGPLAVIMANLDMLNSPSRSPWERELLETAGEGCRDMQRMIQNILECKRMRRGCDRPNLCAVSVPSLFANIRGKAMFLAGRKNLRILTECPGEAETLTADPYLLGRILFNLVYNAIQYTPEGGVVRLTAEGPAPDGEVLLKVADTGVGIAPDRCGEIFQAFSRGDAGRGARDDRMDGYFRGSVGLGLAFCKMAMELHGGRIRVESAEGSGSVFVLSFPARDGISPGEPPAAGTGT